MGGLVDLYFTGAGCQKKGDHFFWGGGGVVSILRLKIYSELSDLERWFISIDIFNNKYYYYNYS